MSFDAWKYYFQIKNPTSVYLDNYSIIKLIWSTTYIHRRRYSRRTCQTKIAVEKWRVRLLFPTIEVTKSTLSNTTNMVQIIQAETREYTRNHYKTRVWAFRLCRIDDDVHSYTFFSNITSIRGFKCFQLFAYNYSKFERIELMRSEANTP